MPAFPFAHRGRAALLALLLAPAAPALAQSYYDEADVAVGYGAAVLHWPSFQTFLDSYHDVNQANLRSRATLPFAAVQSVGFNFLNVIGIRYERLRGGSVAEFNSGFQRHFDLRQHLVLIAVEPAWRGQHWYGGPTFGLGAGQTWLDTYVAYPDGTPSWGRENRVSGSYGATVLSAFAGLRLGYQWQRVQLALRAEWMSKGAGTSDLLDDLPGDTPTSIPTDYADFIRTPPVGVNARVYESVQPDLTSYRVGLQVGLRLNPAH